MESLLLFRRALSSPTMCRFIPALSVTRINQDHLVTRIICHQDRLDVALENRIPGG
jgi:hypothetical protein